MGNRAVVCFDEWENNGVAVYLHWNGGRDSIEGMLKAARILMGGRLGDDTYGRGRLIQVMGMNFPGALSFGVGQCKNFGTDQDNGVYVIDSETLTIKDRIFSDWYADNNETFTEQMEYDTNEFANELIKVINAGYVAANEGQTYPEELLPTAEEYDAAQEAKAAAIKNHLS